MIRNPSTRKHPKLGKNFAFIRWLWNTSYLCGTEYRRQVRWPKRMNDITACSRFGKKFDSKSDGEKDFESECIRHSETQYIQMCNFYGWSYKSESRMRLWNRVHSYSESSRIDCTFFHVFKLLTSPYVIDIRKIMNILNVQSETLVWESGMNSGASFLPDSLPWSGTLNTPDYRPYPNGCALAPECRFSDCHGFSGSVQSQIKVSAFWLTNLRPRFYSR